MVIESIREKIKRIPVLGIWLLWLNRKVRRLRKIARRYVLYRANKNIIRKNSELKDRFAGKRAFVLACGPSIKEQNLKKLAGEFCISVSNFFVHPDFNIIKPEYHVFAESHTPISDEQMVEWLRDAEKHFPDGQKVLLSIVDKPLVEKHDLLKKQHVYYYLMTESRTPYITSVDFAKRIPIIQTVAHQAIYLALYSGAKEIYLLGVDHDLILHLGESRHFYKEEENKMTKLGLSQWHSDWESHFKSYATLWKIYKRIKQYALHHNVKIVNATPGSLLDVFPRAELNDTLK